MFDNNYQNIEYINVSSNNETENNQLDTTGKINEKINNNTYNYFINDIDTETINTNKIIKFVIENDNYVLKEKVAENDFQKLDPPIGTTIFNKANNSIFTLIDINNNIQNWKNLIDYYKPGLKEYYENDTTHEIELRGEIFNVYSGGNKNKAEGAYSHAEGYHTTASGNGGAHSEGANSVASGYASHAGGDHTIANTKSMTTIGRFNTYESSQTTSTIDKLFVVGNGTADDERSDAFVVKNSGETTINGNLNINGKNSGSFDDLVIQYNNGNTTNSLSLGVNGGNTVKITASSGELQLYSGTSPQAYLRLHSGTGSKFDGQAFAFNCPLTVNGATSLTSGTISTTPSNSTDIVNKGWVESNEVGKKYYVENETTHEMELKGEIFNSYSGANKNTASGDSSHAEGFFTTASGISSHAEGRYVNASGNASHAEGLSSEASGDASHAEGSATVTSGIASHAEGFDTKAFGDYSHTGGLHTVADKECMTAIGKYNIYDKTDSTLNDGKLFVVGNGTIIARSDAFVVKDTGDIEYKNNIRSYNGGTFMICDSSSSSADSNDFRIDVYSDNTNTRIVNAGTKWLNVYAGRESGSITTYTENRGFSFKRGNKIEQYGAIEIKNSAGNTSNQTITHNMPIIDDIQNYSIGIPVFISDENKCYYMKEIDYYNHFCYEEIIDNLQNNSIDCVPKVQTTDNGKFIGIITGIYDTNEPYIEKTINASANLYINCPTVQVSTHGDYIFKVDNNTLEHQTTSGSMKRYEIGDELLYDGRIIDPEQPLLRKYESMIIGKITCIPTNNTNYVFVFRI